MFPNIWHNYNNKISCKWEALLDCSSIIVYIEKDMIGVDGISTKLDRFFNYATRTQNITPTPEPLSTINNQLTKWRATKHRNKLALQLGCELASGRDNDTMSLETIEGLKLQTLRNAGNCSVKSSLIDVNTLVIYIFCCLTYKNWKRPGVASNVTLDEARTVDEQFGIHCCQHKTASTYGPTVLVLMTKMQNISNSTLMS